MTSIPVQMQPVAYPVTVTTGQSTWHLAQRTGSGQYIVSEHSTLLARLDRASGCLWLFDKKTKSEVPVRLADLVSLCAAVTSG